MRAIDFMIPSNDVGVNVFASSAPLIVCISGGSGSGKTTLALALARAFEAHHRHCSILSQDNYYIDQSAIFKGDGENVNFDHPDSIDFDLIRLHLTELKQGRSVNVPIYEFASHTRSKTTNPLLASPVVVVEGTLILSQKPVWELCDLRVFVDAPEEIRFARRLKRDLEERGRKPEGVYKQFTKQVQPMHSAFVEPSKSHAELVVSGLTPIHQEVSEIVSRIQLKQV